VKERSGLVHTMRYMSVPTSWGYGASWVNGFTQWTCRIVGLWGSKGVSLGWHFLGLELGDGLLMYLFCESVMVLSSVSLQCQCLKRW